MLAGFAYSLHDPIIGSHLGGIVVVHIVEKLVFILCSSIQLVLYDR